MYANQQHETLPGAIFTDLFEPITSNHINMAASHIHCVNELYKAIINHETLDVEATTKDDCCELGRWLLKESTRLHFGHLHHYHDCVKRHAEFHIQAGKVATLINAKKYGEAFCALCHDSEFSRASTAVIAAIFPFTVNSSLSEN
ncbi:MAG: CZB domain-containing protein [Methylococcaceae bacterium]